MKLNKILDAATSGESTVVEHGGGEVEFVVDGTFGGATVSLLAKFENTTWVPVSESGEPAIWASPLIKSFHISRACQLKLAISGTATEINAWL